MIQTLIDEFVKQTNPSTRPKVYSEGDMIVERERVFYNKTRGPLGLTERGQYILVKDFVRFYISEHPIPADGGEFQYLEATPQGEKPFRIWHCEHIANEMARDLKLASILSI